MSTLYGATDRPPEDLTAPARVRDAAMAQFAELGFKAATMKNIAEAAGVSVGLVQHHFGTKDGLRQACDDAAVEIIQQGLEVVNNLDTEVARPDFASALYNSSPLLVRYMVRLLVDDAPAAAWLFDEMAAGTERFLGEERPELFPPGSQQARDGATVMVAMHLGNAVLHEQLERRMGVNVFDQVSGPRVGLTILDVYTTMADWIASETGQQARSAIADYLDDLAPSSMERDREHTDG